MRREACDDGLAQFAKVVRETHQFAIRDAGIDEQHSGPALYDDGIALNALALVDEHALRNLRQHGPASRTSRIA